MLEGQLGSDVPAFADLRGPVTVLRADVCTAGVNTGEFLGCQLSVVGCQTSCRLSVLSCQ